MKFTRDQVERGSNEEALPFIILFGTDYHRYFQQEYLIILKMWNISLNPLLDVTVFCFK